MDDWGTSFKIISRGKYFSLLQHQTNSGTQPISQPTATTSPFTRSKWPGHEAEHSLPSTGATHIMLFVIMTWHLI